jgi:hypothetical protein
MHAVMVGDALSSRHRMGDEMTDRKTKPSKAEPKKAEELTDSDLDRAQGGAKGSGLSLDQPGVKGVVWQSTGGTT